MICVFRFHWRQKFLYIGYSSWLPPDVSAARQRVFWRIPRTMPLPPWTPSSRFIVECDFISRAHLLWTRSRFPLTVHCSAHVRRWSDAEMFLLDVLGHPVWAVSAALLAIVVRLQRRARWDPRACSARLAGKTAIVTGANTGRSHSPCFWPECRETPPLIY